MNLFLHELRAYRKSAVIWTGSLCALTIVFLVMLYPTFTNDIAASRNVIAHLPPALKDAFGISLQNFFTIFGFYAYLLAFVVLAGAIQAMNLGVGVISKEETGKTADFLLTKPISRSAIMTSKLLAAVSILAVTSGMYGLVSLLAAKASAHESFDVPTFLLLSATLFLVQLAFLALGTLLSVLLPKVKSVSAISIPTVFTFYIIGTLGAIVGNQSVKYITPFKFYDNAYIIAHGSYEVRFLILEALVVSLAIAASYVIFIRKDIRAAA